MSWESGLLIASPIVAVIVGVVIRWWVKRRWKRFWLPDSIPIWVVARAYREWYSDKENLPRRDLTLRGHYYIYQVRSKDKNMIESHARVNNMVIYRGVK